MIIVNFKAFESAVGSNAVMLAKICEKVAKTHNVSISVAVQSADIGAVASAVDIPVLAQHIDCNGFGAFTGSVLPESAKEAGAVGSLVNHSEKRLSIDVIEKSVKRLRDLDLISVVCADTPDMAFKVSKFGPDLVAVEPPELIGGNVSVSTAKPEVITQTTDKIKDIPVLCGAGVKSSSDVKKAIELGAKGVLVASGVTNSKDPEKSLIDLVKGLSQ